MAKAEYMILCDTNVIIEFYKNNSQIIRELGAIGQSNIAVSAITQAELYFGALNKADLRKIRKHLTSIRVISVDISISRKFIFLMENLSLSHRICIPDALVAATALIHSMELYTLNATDFQFVKNIQLFKPTGSSFKSE